jgi:hypothetical protein
MSKSLRDMQYESSNEDENNTQESETKLKNDKGQTWTVVQKFPNASEALNHLQGEKCWSKKRKQKVDTGQKIQYVCKFL